MVYRILVLRPQSYYSLYICFKSPYEYNTIQLYKKNEKIKISEAIKKSKIIDKPLGTRDS